MKRASRGSDATPRSAMRWSLGLWLRPFEIIDCDNPHLRTSWPIRR